QEPPQNSDIHQIIEGCCVEASEEQKQKMEDTMLDLVTLEDKRECDELICENPSTIDVCDNHSEILFDSNNDDLSSDDESFKDIEYVDALVPDPAIVSVEGENVVQQEEEEVDLEDISQVQDIILRENDSILSHESSDSNFEENPSISRPPPEPPDDNFDLEPEVISAVMKDIDEPDEHFDPGRVRRDVRRD
nr:hypothetical protein [Tanacetum cinerariifolium]